MTLTQPECRGGSWPTSDFEKCSQASRGFSQGSGCELFSGPICYYGNADFIPITAPCALTENPTGSNASRCSGQGPPTRWDSVGRQPRFCVKYKSGYTDAEGNADPFESRDSYVTTLAATTIFEIERCAPENTCPSGDFHGIWKTRTFLQDLSGWAMFCTEVLKCDGGGCDQFTQDEISISPRLNGDITFVALSTLVVPQCFPLADQFCYTSFCGLDIEGGKVYACIGDSQPERARTLDSLDVTIIPELGASLIVPTSERELLNAMFASFGDLIDKLDSPGHSPLQPHTSPSIATWSHNETFGVARAIEVTVSGTINLQTFSIDMNAVTVASYVAVTDDTILDVVDGLVTSWNASPDKENVVAYNQDNYLRLVSSVNGETFTVTLNTPGGGATFTQATISDGSPDPVVQGTGTFYSEYEAVDIPITLTGSVSGTVYATTAQLTIQKTGITANLHVENGESGVSRLTGNMVVNVWLRVKRAIGASSGKFDWLNPSDPFDLRLDDPDNPGNVHPRETIVARGPNDEKVWRQSDADPTEGSLKTWEALKCAQTQSRGPNVFGLHGGPECCSVLRAIDNVVLMGKTDDNRGLVNNWFKETTATIENGPISGETFSLTIGGNEIASHTDTTGIIEDTIDALVSAWNGSADPIASLITATKVSASSILLVADDPLNTDFYSITGRPRTGSPKMVIEDDQFTELPQRYDGSASFQVDFGGTFC